MNNPPVISIQPSDLSTGAMHQYLLAAVAPRPICFASTIDAEGQVNLSPFSYFNVFSTNPAVMVFSPARRGRDNTTKHTYDNLKEVPETVINIVNYPMVEQMSLASAEYPKGVNEFEKAGFSQIASQKVRPPRVGESPVAFECVVDDLIELGQEGGAGVLVVARVVLMHIQQAYLGEDYRLDSADLDLVARMGGSWYCRANGDALFQIPKPLKSLGIGVDSLPASVRLSPVLTGNDLGRLGNLGTMPSEEAIAARHQQPSVRRAKSAGKIALHQLAQEMIRDGDVVGALEVLCTPLDIS
ncbi:MAG: flavin reductase family protein [Bacteroidota bacterium]